MNNKSIINSTIYTDTNIEIIPDTSIGNVESYCIGEPEIDECTDNSYYVNQLVNVRFPIRYSARVRYYSNKLACRDCVRDCIPTRKRRRKNCIKRLCFCILALYCGIIK